MTHRKLSQGEIVLLAMALGRYAKYLTELGAETLEGAAKEAKALAFEVLKSSEIEVVA